MAKELDNKKMWTAFLTSLSQQAVGEQINNSTNLYIDLCSELKRQGFEYKDGGIVPIDEEPELFKVEEGKWYMCIQTFILRGKIVTIKGQTYTSKDDNVIYGEEGCLFIDRHDGRAKDYFRPATDEEIPHEQFCEGDWIVYDHRPYQVVELPKEGYINLGLKGNGKIEFAPSTYCRHWTIQDAKDGDVLCYKDEISLYKHDIKNCTKQETTFGGFVYHCCYDGKRFIMDSLYSLTEQDKMDIHPATKEERDLLFAKMKEEGYEWSEKDRKLIKIVK